LHQRIFLSFNIQIMGRVTHGKFSYDVDTFYVEASGHPHRRAIPAELRAIFDASIPDRNQRPDHPAHWFEAQLLHYGLSPSKVKATAKMRLLDAIQDGILEVPIELVEMEKRLKKEWKRQDAAACVLSSGHAHSATSGITNTTTTETVTRNTVITSSFIPQKRARDTKDDRFKDRPTVKQTARRVGMGKVSVPSNDPQPTAFQPQERPKPELPNQARQRQASGVPNRPPQTARKTVVGTGSEGHSYESPSTASYSQQIRQIPGPRTVANESSGLSGGIGQVGIRSLAPSHRDGLQTVSIFLFVPFFVPQCKS
jgi:hypothetical protein